MICIGFYILDNLKRVRSAEDGYTRLWLALTSRNSCEYYLGHACKSKPKNVCMEIQLKSLSRA